MMICLRVALPIFRSAPAFATRQLMRRPQKPCRRANFVQASYKFSAIFREFGGNPNGTFGALLQNPMQIRHLFQVLLATPAGPGQYNKFNRVDCPTCPEPGVDFIAENSALPNRSEKKNAGAEATATDVNSCKNGSYRTANNTPKWGKDSTHNRAGRTVEFALTMGTSDAWHAASFVFAARLTEAERAALAYAALHSLDNDTAYMTASAALFGVLGGEVLS